MFFLLQIVRLFSIEKIEVKGSADREIIGLKEAYGQNIFVFDTDKFKNRIKLLNSYIKRVEVYKEYPDRLRVEVSYRRPLGYLKVNKGYYLLDEEGRILERLRKQEVELPIINFYQRFNFDDFLPGEFLEYTELSYSLKILELLDGLGLRANGVDILRGDMIRFNLKENDFRVNVIYATVEKEIDKQMWELKEIFRYIKISGKKASEVDLRFKRPILRR